MIVFLMLLNSVMQGMGATACQRLVGLWFGRKGKGSIMARGTAFSIWSSAHNAGAFMSVAVINLSALFFGASLQWSFWTASIVSIVIAVIVLFLGSDRPTTKGLPTIEEYSGDKVVIKDGEVVEGDVSDESKKMLATLYFLMRGSHFDFTVNLRGALWHHELDSQLLGQCQRI